MLKLKDFLRISNYDGNNLRKLQPYMSKDVNLVKIHKSKSFSLKEVSDLTGFSRTQLDTLSESEIVVPYRKSLVLYTWKQVIFLKIISNLRKDYTFKQVEKALKECPHKIEDLIENIDKTLLIGFGRNLEGLGFAFVFVSNNDDFKSHTLSKVFNDEQGFNAIMAVLMETETIKSAQMRFNIITAIKVPDLIKELKQLAMEKEIKDFENKIKEFESEAEAS